MEEPALLLPVQRIVGGIQVQDDQRRGLGLALQEQIDEQRFDRCRIVADLMVARRLRPAQFQPVQRRLARDRRTIGPNAEGDDLALELAAGLLETRGLEATLLGCPLARISHSE
jgi:hypothetical protein